MDRDIKDVIGILMRVLDGDEVSHEELDELAFEADGELETALTEAYVKMRASRRMAVTSPACFETALKRLLSMRGAV